MEGTGGGSGPIVAYAKWASMGLRRHCWLPRIAVPLTTTTHSNNNYTRPNPGCVTDTHQPQ